MAPRSPRGAGAGSRLDRRGTGIVRSHARLHPRLRPDVRAVGDRLVRQGRGHPETEHIMTLARVVLTLSGFASIVNGLVELGPDARPPITVVGVALILLGVLTWALVGRMRRPGAAPVRLTAAVTVAVAAAQLAQFAILDSPAVLLAIALPAVAWWAVAR